ncbi:hypothetical protein [Halobacillus sp. Marseille-P3879]|uniref:hypothetical protein n=1 Tax=Halobacillus sp. Marseille-P3879 TaxID=2045014 RepID=UPI000C7BE0C3|nr:hypothetical protein [Halobacillus sp. Marseille-P3879]
MAQKNNKIVISYNRDKETRKEIVQAKKEQAATEAEKIQERRPDSYSKVRKIPSFQKRLSPFSYKHVSLSIITAIVVSFALGFILLKLFVTVTEESPPPESNVTSGNQAQSQSAGAVMAGVELPALESEVVQSGVFTSLETAEEWQGNLTEQSLPSVIWKQQDQYFLLSGSADGEDGVDKVAADLADMDIPTYLKTWEVTAGEVEVPKSQTGTIESLITHLQENTLHTVSVEEREKILNEWKEADGGSHEEFEAALKGWVDETNHGVSWLSLAKSLESMKN